MLALLALWVASAAACDAPCAAADTVLSGSSTSIVEEVPPECRCRWVFEYSSGPTVGEVLLSVAGLAPDVRVFSSDSSPVAVFSEPLESARAFSSTGMLVVEVSTADAPTTVNAAVAAINTPPDVQVLDTVVRTGSDLFGETLVFAIGATFPLPISVRDYDSWAAEGSQLTATVSLQEVPSPFVDSRIVFEIVFPETDGVRFLSGRPGRPGSNFVMRGSASAIQAAFEGATVRGLELDAVFNILAVVVSDSEGGTTSVTELVSVTCGNVVLDPESSIMSTGISNLRNGARCTFLIERAATLDFDFLRLQVDNTTGNCIDWVRIYDGRDTSGKLLSTQLSSGGELCGTGVSTRPFLRSLTGSFFVDVYTDDSEESSGFFASIGATPNMFSVQLLETAGNSTQISAAAGFPTILPAIIVYDVPGQDLLLRVSASVGEIGLVSADSFASEIIEGPGPQFVLLTADPDALPMVRMGEALSQLTFTPPADFRGDAVLTLVAESAGEVSEALQIVVLVEGVGVTTPGPVMVSANNTIAIPVAITAAETEIEVVVSADVGLLSVDPRTEFFVPATQAPEIVLSGLPSAVTETLQKLSFVHTDATMATVTVTAGAAASVSFVVEVIAQCLRNRILYGVDQYLSDRSGPIEDPYEEVTCSWVIDAPVVEFLYFDVNGRLGSTFVLFDRLESVPVFTNGQDPEPRYEAEGGFQIFFSPQSSDGTGFLLRTARSTADQAPRIVLSATNLRQVAAATVPLGEHVWITDYDSAELSVQIETEDGSLAFDSNAALQVAFTGTLTEVDAWLQEVELRLPDALGTLTVTVSATDDAGLTSVSSLVVETVGCHGTTVLGGLSASFDDGSRTARYSSRSSCNWLLQGAQRPGLLEFDTFDLETLGTECPDSVTIYDGSSAQGRLIGSFCSINTLRSSTLLASSGSFFIEFRTDDLNQADGFSGRYQSLPSRHFFLLREAPRFQNPDRIGAAVSSEDLGSMLVVGGKPQGSTRPILSPIKLSARGDWRVLEAATPGVEPAPRSNAILMADLRGALLAGGEPEDVWRADMSQEADGLINWILVGPTPAVLTGGTGHIDSDGTAVCIAGTGVFSLAAGASEWTQLSSEGAAAGAHASALDGNSILVYDDAGGLRRLDIATGAWGATLAGSMGATAPMFGVMLGTEFALLSGGQLHALDATTDAWIVLSDEAPTGPAVSSLVSERPGLFLFSEGVAFGFSLGLNVRSVAPKALSSRGGTVVTVTGDEFGACANPECVFGSESSSALVDGTRLLTCEAPPMPSSEASLINQLSIACDGSVRASAPSDQAIGFYGVVAIVSVSPQVLQPGQLVVLSLEVEPAEVLELVDEPLCDFDGADAVAGTLSGLQVTCMAPETLQRGSDVVVRVSLDGQQFGSEAVVPVRKRSDDVQSLLLLPLIFGTLGVLGWVYMRRENREADNWIIVVITLEGVDWMTDAVFALSLYNQGSSLRHLALLSLIAPFLVNVGVCIYFLRTLFGQSKRYREHFREFEAVSVIIMLASTITLPALRLFTSRLGKANALSAPWTLRGWMTLKWMMLHHAITESALQVVIQTLELQRNGADLVVVVSLSVTCLTVILALARSALRLLVGHDASTEVQSVRSASVSALADRENRQTK